MLKIYMYWTFSIALNSVFVLLTHIINVSQRITIRFDTRPIVKVQ